MDSERGVSLRAVYAAAESLRADSGRAAGFLDSQEFTRAENERTECHAVGGRAGDAPALTCDLSIIRARAGAARTARSREAASPLPSSDLWWATTQGSTQKEGRRDRDRPCRAF